MSFFQQPPQWYPGKGGYDTINIIMSTALSLLPPPGSVVATTISKILGQLPFYFHAVHARLEEDYRRVR